MLRRVSWEQTLLNALVSALIVAVGTTWAARRNAGAVERAAERGAKAGVEAAALTAAATRESAELARRTVLDKSQQDDRRAQVRPLQEIASQREQFFRYAVGVLQTFGDVSRSRTLLDKGNTDFPLDGRYRYVGIDHAEFHAAVQAYWNADLWITAELWAFHATEQVLEWASGQGEPVLSQARQIAEAERPARKTGLADALTALHEAVVTLHKGAEAYIRGD